MLGGGGLVAANVYASATEGGTDARVLQAGGWGPGSATIDCPDVGSRLTSVPDDARADVDRELALLDQQVSAAYQQLQASAQAVRQDPGSADGTIMNPLKEKRSAAIERIATAIDRVGDRPQGLADMAACTLRPPAQQGGAQGGQNSGTQNQGGEGQNGNGQNGNGGSGQGGNGPVAADYTDITTVQPNVQAPAPQADASRGTFTSSCGVNANGLFNSDNVIVAPGVTNGAHHFHDYIGNQSNNAFASDDDLANADTSCVDQGDRSTYYWPVLRLQNGTRERDANAPGGGTEGNAGQIVTAKDVTLTFEGSPRGKVTAMPRLLRIITGDAKAFVNGPANANASWSCTGYEDRQLKDKYPLCPSGSDVVRTFRFQSCWDGRNIDSANHRTHVAFADAEGKCPGGFQAIPQLVQRIVYDVTAPSLQDGGRTHPLFAVDSFPEQQHKPVTDHGDFINVFDEGLMREMVDCINSGRTCGAGGKPGGTPSPSADASPGDGGQANPGNGGGEQPTQQPSEQPSAQQPTQEQPPSTEQPSSQRPSTEAPSTEAPSTEAPSTQPADDPGTAPAPAPTTKAPRVFATTSSTRNPSAAPNRHGSHHSGAGRSTPSSEPSTTAAAEPSATAGQTAPQTGAQTEPQTEPQAQQGSLAETGAHLWPGALGAVLLIAGFVVLRRGRRSAR
ncbi:DUF1996 domain-containing protein [Streptomyces sp. NPDC001480]|uniref:DUF1996 domain-containing protein n=1 Tax=Streptomyces sp. NPDC001480 TaxID=3364577 RepID=UPI0036AAD098